MKHSIVPKDSRYIPLVQERSCCVPACISMIMYRHGLPLLPQQLIGHHLGLVVKKEDLRLFWNIPTGKRPPGGYGTRSYIPKYEVNRALARLKIPLRMKFWPIAGFTDKEAIGFLGKISSSKKDFIACFDHGELRGDHIPGGHVALVDKVDLKKKEVRLLDPQQSQPKWRIVKISKLIQAMRFHGGENMSGFWEFELTS